MSMSLMVSGGTINCAFFDFESVEFVAVITWLSFIVSFICLPVGSVFGSSSSPVLAVLDGISGIAFAVAVTCWPMIERIRAIASAIDFFYTESLCAMIVYDFFLLHFVLAST